MTNIFNIKIPKTLVLIGMMGVGKTSIGRKLARRLDLKFTDSDHEVEVASACSVADIFSLYGESAFHEVERRVIKRLLNESPCVLATGGSAFAVFETRQLIKQHAISIWLKADLETILPRIERRDHRPQFAEGSARSTLEELIETYHPLYAEADIQIPCDNTLPDATTEKIIIELNRYMSKLEMERDLKITHV
ncbi:MAG: shikimate kinase [Alphaproteobacteria bacterium]|nr:shikimate kinase [Alphaproteobacteria bacterium]